MQTERGKVNPKIIKCKKFNGRLSTDSSSRLHLFRWSCEALSPHSHPQRSISHACLNRAHDLMMAFLLPGRLGREEFSYFNSYTINPQARLGTEAPRVQDQEFQRNARLARSKREASLFFTLNFAESHRSDVTLYSQTLNCKLHFWKQWILVFMIVFFRCLTPFLESFAGRAFFCCVSSPGRRDRNM